MGFLSDFGHGLANGFSSILSIPGTIVNGAMNTVGALAQGAMGIANTAVGYAGQAINNPAVMGAVAGGLTGMGGGSFMSAMTGGGGSMIAASGPNNNSSSGSSNTMLLVGGGLLLLLLLKRR